MKRVAFNWRGLAALLAFLGVTSGPVKAEDPWEFGVLAYLWAASISGSLETPVATVDFDKDFSEIVSDLDLAVMVAFEARKGPWGFIADFIYMDVSGSRSTPRGILFDRAKLDLQSIIGTGYLGYRVLDTESVSIDALAAFRVWSLDSEVKLTAGLLPEQRRNFGDTWVDPVIGARVQVALDEHWHLMGLGDVGGFGVGSDLAWQLYGTVNYKFDDTWSAYAGYRYLSVKRDFGSATMDAQYQGPMLGVGVRF